MLYKSFIMGDTVYYIKRFINGKKLRYYLFTDADCLGVWDNPRLAMNRAIVNEYKNKYING